MKRKAGVCGNSSLGDTSRRWGRGWGETEGPQGWTRAIAALLPVVWGRVSQMFVTSLKIMNKVYN